jgi:hypothetical protein
MAAGLGVFMTFGVPEGGCGGGLTVDSENAIVAENELQKNNNRQPQKNIDNVLSKMIENKDTIVSNPIGLKWRDSNGTVWKIVSQTVNGMDVSGSGCLVNFSALQRQLAEKVKVEEADGEIESTILELKDAGGYSSTICDGPGDDCIFEVQPEPEPK